MPRKPRNVGAGDTVHVTSRAVAGAAMFTDDRDRTRFLNALAVVVERYRWRCRGYCLMTNHYHLVVETPLGNLAAGMQALNGGYAQWFNRRHGRRGHLLEGRYRSTRVERESHLLELCRYLDLNAVRAGICRLPRDWRWSSYRATVGLAPRPPFLAVDRVLRPFGRDLRRAVVRYAVFVADGLPRRLSRRTRARPRTTPAAPS